MKNDNERQITYDQEYGYAVAYCTDDEIDDRFISSQTLLPYQVGEFNRAVVKTNLFVMSQYPHPAEYYVEQIKRGRNLRAKRKRCFSHPVTK